MVIVVSHDREFAEQYGDRVIELKDSLYLKYDESQTLTDFASFRTIAPFSAFPVIRESVVFFKEGQTTLGKNEILISFNDFQLNVIHEVISHSTKLFEGAYKAEYDKAIAVYRENYADEIASYREEQYQQYLYQGYSPETVTYFYGHYIFMRKTAGTKECLP